MRRVFTGGVIAVIVHLLLGSDANVFASPSDDAEPLVQEGIAFREQSRDSQALSTIALDRTRKTHHYARAGFGHLWFIDPEPQTLEIFAWRRRVAPGGQRLGKRDDPRRAF